MKTERLGFLPEARSVGIISKEVDGELLIYDLKRHKALCLNRTAALVWKRCDGGRSIPELAHSVSRALGVPVDETVVQLALKQLSRDHLLAEAYDVPPVAAGLSRRSVVRRLGVAAVLLPLITAITTPTALAAVSCGGPCSGGPGRGTCPLGCICPAGTCVNA